MTDVRIRTATDEDWPRIWPFFSAIVVAGETYAFPEDLTVETGRGWWMERPPGLTVVLEEEDQVLGSAKMGPNRPGRGDHVGTASFMVEPSAAGRGVGRALASYVVAWHLWQSLGFEIVGTVPRAFRSRAHGEVGLHVMYLDLR